MEDLEKITQENEAVRNFITEWTEVNGYSKELTEHNEKFKIDFNSFLDNGNFSKATIDLFKIKDDENN